jgi:geranylgeranyl diphosphate synthase type II
MTALSLPLRTVAVAHVPDSAAARAFAARQLPQFEAALALETCGLLPELPGHSEALALAAGVHGTAGHRWRPLLSLAAGVACGARPADLMPVAVAAELTHTASLILDDLPCMDNSPLRRGVAATHRLVGQDGAILLAIGLMARAVEVLGRAPRTGAALADAWGRMVGLRGMAGGQIVDLLPSTGERGARRRLYRQKTVALAAFALSAAGVAAEAPAPAIAALDHFGRDLGWAYQLADDADDRSEDVGRGTRGPSGVRGARRLINRGERELLAAAPLFPGGTALLGGFARLALAGLREDAC